MRGDEEQGQTDRQTDGWMEGRMASHQSGWRVLVAALCCTVGMFKTNWWQRLKLVSEIPNCSILNLWAWKIGSRWNFDILETHQGKKQCQSKTWTGCLWSCIIVTPIHSRLTLCRACWTTGTSASRPDQASSICRSWEWTELGSESKASLSSGFLSESPSASFSWTSWAAVPITATLSPDLASKSLVKA